MEHEEIEALRQARQGNGGSRVLDRITDGFLVVDLHWHLLYANLGARALLDGLEVRKPSSSEISNAMSIWLRWPDLAGSNLYRELHRAFALGHSAVVQQFVPQLDRWLEVHAYPDDHGMSLLLRDVTSRKEYELQLAAQYAVTSILESAATIRKAVRPILEVLLADLHWQVAVFWKRDAAAKALRCYDLCQASSDVAAVDFEAACRNVSLTPWQGSPGRAWARNAPTWMEIGKDDDPQRIAAARPSGLHFSFCFPVRIQDAVIGVIELAARHRRQPGNEMTLALEAIGVQIGRFVERKHKDRQLHGRVLELETIYQAADAASRLGTLEEICEAGLTGLEHGLKTDRSAVLLFDAAGVLRVRACRGLSKELGAALEANPPWPQDTAGAEPIFNPNVSHRPALDSLRPALLAEGLRAVGLVPLFTSSKLLGMLLLGYDKPLRFRQQHLRLAKTLASHIAVAVGRQLAEQERIGLLQREQEARAAAERANRAKDEFLATVSHELRTPLTAMLGYSRLLRTRRLDQSNTEMALETIERNARLQAQMIEDLLDHSRLMAGKLRLEREIVDLEAIVESTVAVLRPAAEAKDLSLNVTLAGQPVMVLGDPQRLQQVVSNLLDNAIKFTPDGGRIDVQLALHDSNARLEIRDTGKGIAPEFLPYIFDLFRQADPSSSRAEGGLGLGLALVKQFVDLHAGAVWAESGGLGQGTTFYVQLALCPGVSRESADAGETAETEPALNGVRILAVDDNQDTRQFLALALERFGASVVTADSARQAMDVLESFGPQVLISDLAMPQEDGYVLIRRVREHERGNQSRVPAIALSAYSRIEDQRTALQAGFDVHVAKPVQPATLATAVARLLKKVG